MRILPLVLNRGVTGTPAFFINGRLIAGAYPFSEFKKIIDEELAGGQNKPTEARANVEIMRLQSRVKQVGVQLL